MDSLSIDERHFINPFSQSSFTTQELGHQTVNPVFLEWTRALSEGFLAGLVLQASDCGVPYSWLTLPALMSMETFVSDCSKQLSYDHEYAREVWEHEHNNAGEIVEYVTYATSRGIEPMKARQIAESITAEPAISVPYHLAFELGITEPILYKRKFKHAATIGAGYSGGMFLSRLAGEIFKSISSESATVTGSLTKTGICILMISPVLFFRYRNLWRVSHGSKFKITTLMAYCTSICLVVYLSRRT